MEGDMTEYQEVEEFLEAIERQQNVAKIEENIRLLLTAEQRAMLDSKLLILGTISDPASATDIHIHTNKKLDILKEFLVYADENTVLAPDELEHFVFEAEISEAGLWAQYEIELKKRAVIREKMEDHRGKPRGMVEEYLAKTFQLERRRVKEVNEMTCCLYAGFWDEEGYWQLTFDDYGRLISYREITNQLEDLYRKRLDVLYEIKMGSGKQAVETLLESVGYTTVGTPDRWDGNTIQKYGYQRGNKSIAIVRIFYNHRGWVIQKNLIPQEEIL